MLQEFTSNLHAFFLSQACRPRWPPVITDRCNSGSDVSRCLEFRCLYFVTSTCDPEQVAAKSFGMDETMAAIKWAETSGTVPGTWKLSSDGWMRELKLRAGESHLLGYYATKPWSYEKTKARTELKKRQEQQEREQRKRPAEEQPEGTAESKRDKQTRWGGHSTPGPRPGPLWAASLQLVFCGPFGSSGLVLVWEETASHQSASQILKPIIETPGGELLA